MKPEIRISHNAPAINLALQGGGSHGAYTWGVLDRLLEENWRLDGVSGTSAGAMNAAALAHGWTKGGADGAREALHRFWNAVADSTPLHLDMLHAFGTSAQRVAAPVKLMLDLAHKFSPYQVNPLELNPLRDVVRDQIDFEHIRAECPLKLFIAATHVRTGNVRLFRTHEISEAALMASACLPTLHHAVEVDGEMYWDGGFTANPAIYPLMYECDTQDILMILLSPLTHQAMPRTADDIASRSMDLGFSTTFLREMRMLAQTREFIGQSAPQGRFENKIMGLRCHMIEAEELADAGRCTKTNASRWFIEKLHDQGRARADRWLRDSKSSVGRASSIDLGKLFNQDFLGDQSLKKAA